MKKPNMLIILDGFGLNESSYGNAIKKANTPNLDELFSKYPFIKLGASGLDVGLPSGQMGNSEVGHLNIGAGRIVYQDLTKITKDIDDGAFFKNPQLLSAINHVKKNNSTLHIFGLLSDGGVHSHISHIKALFKLANDNGIKRVYLHAFTDGRDVSPTSGISYVKEMKEYFTNLGIGKFGSISGRFYAMDRDKRWDRVEKAYDALTCSLDANLDVEEYLKESYKENITDEFIEPKLLDSDGIVKSHDSIIFANFRPDRAREITRAFVYCDFDGFDRKVKLSDIEFCTMTEYDSNIKNVKVCYPNEEIKNTLGEYVSNLGLKQLRIAETEKYAHVTFFFNGGVEKENIGEDRILIPSPKVKTYDMLPQMSAYEVCDNVINEINKDKYDLIILNFANADMVGHTGNFDAAVKAIETLDELVSKIVKVVLSKDGNILLTADHGNSDYMLDDDGNVVTSHSLNPVPLCYISNSNIKFKKDSGKLSDIAPTLLKIMGIDKPEEMTGDILI